MNDTNLAIVLTLMLLAFVIFVFALSAKRWIKKFALAMVQAKQAQREQDEEAAAAGREDVATSAV